MKRGEPCSSAPAESLLDKMEDRLLDRLVARLDDRDRDRSRKKRQRGDESPPKPSNPDRGTTKK